MSRSLSRWQALLLGLVVLVGIGLGVLALFSVGSRGWFGKEALHVRVGFAEIRGVEVGTRVRIQGMDAGEVVSITPPEEAGAPVVLRLRLKSEYGHLVRSSSTVQIVGEGMLGNKVLEIHRARPQPGALARADEPAAEDALLRSEPSTELADVIGQVGDTLKNVQSKDGPLGKLANDGQALLQQSRQTMVSIQQIAEGIKRAPIINRYVEDPQAILVRPNCERNRQLFAEEELFESGRAVLTAGGRERLDRLAPWLEGLKHKGSEVVVVSYADPHSADSTTAKKLTELQSNAVCEYLEKHHHHALASLGTFSSSRKVTPLGMGTETSPVPEEKSLPPARVEVLVFVPQS